MSTPLDYRSPQPPEPPPPSGAGQFIFGLLTGIVISFVVWFAGWNAADGVHGESIFYTVLTIKIFGGMALLFLTSYRRVGLGLIVSLPIGALIFFMSCSAHVSHALRGL